MGRVPGLGIADLSPTHLLGNSPLNGIFGTGFLPPWQHAPALLIFPLAALILALLPATGKWCGTTPPPPRFPGSYRQ
ncbi:hypothetical protein [Nocardia thailandica]